MSKRFNTSYRVLFYVLVLLFLATNISVHLSHKYHDSISRSKFTGEAAVCSSSLKLNINSVIDISKAQANNYIHFFEKSKKANSQLTTEYIKEYDVTKIKEAEFGNVFFNSKITEIPEELNEINNILYFYSLDNYSKFNNTLCVYYSTDNYIVIYPKLEIDQILPKGHKLDFSEDISTSIKNVKEQKEQGNYQGYDLNIFPQDEQLIMQVTIPVIKNSEIKGFLTSNFIVTSMLKKLIFDKDIHPYVSIGDYILSYKGNQLKVYEQDYLSQKYSERLLKNNLYTYPIISENDLPFSVSYFYIGSRFRILDYVLANIILAIFSILSFLILNRYYKKVNQLEEIKTEFLLTVSHEVKNPLMLISGHAQSVIDCNEVSTLQNSLTLIQSESNRLANVINNILYYLRTDEQNIILLKEKIDIRQLFTEILSLYKGIEKVKISSLVDDNLSYFYADREKIRRVILNLMINAREATERGEITLYAKREAKMLKVGVKDTGIGINKEKQNKIFNTFYTDKKDGSGLGLAISKQIINKHSGSFKVISEPNKGSDFSFILPIE